MVYNANTEYDVNDLFHYGVVGMHWGIRRYQPYSYTDGRDYGESGREIGLAAKLGRGIKSAKSGIEAYRKTAKKKAVLRKARRAKAAKIKAAEKEEKRLAKEEKKKEDLINSGDIDKVIKNKSKLTTDEIRRATDRIVAENRLKDIESEEAMKAIDRGKRLVSSVADMTKNFGSIYDTATGIQKKMQESAAAKEKKANEKRMMDTVKTADAVKINEAIENGDLTPEYIKIGKEAVQNKRVMLTEAKSITKLNKDMAEERAKDTAERGRMVYETLQKEASERYKKNVLDKVNPPNPYKENANRAVDEVLERVGLKTKEGFVDLKPNEKKTYTPTASQRKSWNEQKAATIEKGLAEAKSRPAKKGWETRRKNQAAKETAAYNEQLENKIAERRSTRESYIAKEGERRKDDAVKSLLQSRSDSDSRSAYSKHVDELQSRGQEKAMSALEELLKKGYSL